MSDKDEIIVRQLEDIQRRLDQLEARSVMSYGKGTYSPTYLGSVTPGATTYTLQSGAWVRIGSLAVIHGAVVWTAATGTGNAQISLPFTILASNPRASGSVRVNGVTFANSAPQVEVDTGLSLFTLQSPLTNAAPTTVAIEAAGNIVFTVAFRIA